MVSKKKDVKKSVVKADKEASVMHEGDANVYQNMIAEAAYYKAESKGFVAGYDMENWLEAENEIMNNPDNP